MIKAIALKFGYVESNSLSWLVFSHNHYDGGKIAQSSSEAVNSLVEFLYLKFGKPRPSTKKCCNKTLKTMPDADFCPKCGNSLKAVFHVSSWQDYLYSFLSCDIDRFGYSDGIDNPYGWDPSIFSFDVPDNQIVQIHCHADKIFTMALFKLHPELIDMADDLNDIPVNDPDHYLWDEYREMMDVECSAPPLATEGVCKYVCTYANEAKSFVEGEELKQIIYNTDDTVWFDDGKVVRVLTHDGVEWNDDEGLVLHG